MENIYEMNKSSMGEGNTSSKYHWMHQHKRWRWQQRWWSHQLTASTIINGHRQKQTINKKCEVK